MKHSVLVVGIFSSVTMSLLAGCASSTQTATYALAAEPAPGAAQQLRNWEPTQALYASGDTEAGVSPFRYQPKPDDRKYNALVNEPSVFAANMFTWPWTLWENRNRKSQTFSGVVIPPTSTLARPLPGKPFIPEYSPTPSAELVPAEPVPAGELGQIKQPPHKGGSNP